MIRLVPALLVCLLVACSPKAPPSPAMPPAAAGVGATASPSATIESLEPVRARAAAAEVVAALKRRDMATVAKYAHPERGVLFAPYAYIEVTQHQVWTAAALPGWFADTAKRQWGTEDGTGFPIEKTPTEYFERFVFPKDFTTGATINVNADQARGNAINNAATVYPDGVRVEFYLPPTQTPEGPNIDWRALRLVFVGVAGEAKLIAVIHDQWTI